MSYKTSLIIYILIPLFILIIFFGLVELSTYLAKFKSTKKLGRKIEKFTDMFMDMQHA